MTQRDLREAFAAYGPVIIVGIGSDEGFIEMSWQAHAVAAIDALDGAELKGCTMNVSRTLPPDAGGSRGNPRRGWDVVGGGRSH